VLKKIHVGEQWYELKLDVICPCQKKGKKQIASLHSVFLLLPVSAYYSIVLSGEVRNGVGLGGQGIDPNSWLNS